MQLFDIGKKKWGDISRIAQTTTIVPSHGLKGQEPNRSKGYSKFLGPGFVT